MSGSGIASVSCETAAIVKELLNRPTEADYNLYLRQAQRQLLSTQAHPCGRRREVHDVMTLAAAYSSSKMRIGRGIPDEEYYASVPAGAVSSAQDRAAGVR